MIPTRFLNLFSRQVWAIDAGYVRGIISALPGLLEVLKARQGAAPGERKAAGPVLSIESKKIGVLKLSGPLVKGVDPVEAEWYGLASYDQVHAAADKVKSEGIGHLVLHLDSPGGMVTGCAEAADRLLQLRESGVAITAYSDTLMCSAAYWLAAACDEIVTAPSAMVGSIGCILLCLDNSGLYEKIGLKPEYFVNSGSEAKLYGRSGQPWTEEARASFQESVDVVGTEFKNFLAENRPDLYRADMNGDAWDAVNAPAGYVDYLSFPDPSGISRPVSTIGDLLAILSGTRGV
jgi:ClpP class serine protease